MTSGIVADLVSPVSYTIGDLLGLEITITAPEDGTYYILGAMYDRGYNYIPGTLFGVLTPLDDAYAYNSYELVSIWRMAKDEEKVLDCRFTFVMSNVHLKLTLMRMVGAEASLDDDKQKASTMLYLTGEAEVGLSLNSIVSLLVVAGMAGIMVKTMD